MPSDNEQDAPAPPVVAAPSIMQSNIPLPPKLELSGNLAQNWKRWKQLWDSYVIVSEINQRPQEYQVATFITCIGMEGLEVYNGLPFKNEADKKNPKEILKLMTEYCVGKTNTIYERYVFNNRNQELAETFDAYVSKLRKLSITCEYGPICDELIRDRLVCGIRDNAVRKKLLQEAELTLEKCVNVCRAAEKTAVQLKTMSGQEDVHIVKKKPSAAASGFSKAHNANKRGQRNFGKAPAKSSTCRYCGKQHPFDKTKCPAYGKTCSKCNKKNHFAAVCKQAEKKNKVHFIQENSDSEDEILIVEENVSVLNDNTPSKIFAHMDIENQRIKFQVDCGATCNIINRTLIPRTVKIEKSSHTLKMYNSMTMKATGQCTLTLRNPKNDQCYETKFIVVDDETQPLLGAKTIQEMNLVQVQFENILSVQTVMNMQQIANLYSDVFHGEGKFKEKLHLEIDNSVQPVKVPLRRVPIALKPLLKAELERLQRMNVIKPVDTPTDWVSSLVVVKKPSGKLRICIDPKPLNKALQRSHYPLPVIEDLLPELAKARVFTVCDVKNGFWHIELDEPSSYLTTFETPFGRYRWIRMPFGISPAPEIFQHRLETEIQNLEGVKPVADDVLIYGEGETDEEATQDHDRKLIKFLDRCREAGIKLNKEKFKLRRKEMPYVGHLLTAEGLKPDPEKVKAIKQMETPKDVKGVQRLVGLVNYLTKFLKELSMMCEPLRNLTLKGVEWKWTFEHDQAFEKIKEAVCNAPVLRYFDPKEETTLQCDASDTGLGATLLQKGQPVAYASRALTSTEKNYAQIEKELLAVVYGMEKFNQYTYGRKVLVESHHKPLEIIYKKPLVAAPKRLQRMLLRLQKYDIDIVYKQGSTMYLADTLSRAHLVDCKENEEQCQDEIFSIIENVNMLDFLPVTKSRLQEIQQASGEDPSLQILMDVIMSGWPDTKSMVPMEVHPYFHVRDELSVQNGIVFRGSRCIIPKSLRRSILEKIHSSHIGAEGCLRRARDCVYWPSMNTEITDMISKCETCRTYETAQQKETFIAHDTPNRPWAVIASDLFTSPVGSEEYLITVDYYSNFWEIDRLEDTSSKTVIKKLKQHFARHGIPDKLITDNGPQFTSEHFKNFKRKWDFEHSTSSPAYPQSNGKAESAVKTAKRLIRKAYHSGQDPWLAVLDHRNTPSQGIGASPTQRLMNRRTKTLLPTKGSLLMPSIETGIPTKINQEKQRQAMYYNRSAKDLPVLSEGETVRIQPTNRDKMWRKGQIVEKVSDRSYKVKTDYGTDIRRNRRHLRRSRETFENDLNIYDNLQPSEIVQEQNAKEDNIVKETVPNENDAVIEKPSVQTSRCGRQIKPPSYLKDFVK